MIVKWCSEGKKDIVELYVFEGNVYYCFEKYLEVIVVMKQVLVMIDKFQSSWNQILMVSYVEFGQNDQVVQFVEQQFVVNLNDIMVFNNVVVVMMQVQKYLEVIVLMEKVKVQGVLKSEKDYVNFVKFYFIIGQNLDDLKLNVKKVVQMFEEGMSKGVVLLFYDNYKLFGDVNYVGGNESKVIDVYKKVMLMGKDGEVVICVGQLLFLQNKYSEVCMFIQQGIVKGVQYCGMVYMMLVEVECGLKNKFVVIVVMKQVVQDLDIVVKVKDWLKKVGVK